MLPQIFIKIGFVTLLCIANFAVTYAQTDAGAPSRPAAQKEDDFPESFRENLAKLRIKAEQKEYDELIQRGEEAVKLSEEIYKDFEAKKNLTAEDTKKIVQLEKVVKKIRQDLGAKDDSETETTDEDPAPKSLENIVKNIRETTGNLLSELKKTTRHSISVIAVQSSNSLLKLVKFIKFNKD